MRLIRTYILLALLMSARWAWAQSYDIYIDNRRITTDTTMEFDVFIKNTGTTNNWALRSYQSGYKISAAFVNGGTIVGSYVPGSSEMETTFNKLWGFSWNNTSKVLNQSSNTGSSCPGGLIGRIPKKIGRFKLRNSVSWGCGEDSISIMTSGSGFLKLAVTKYDEADCSVAFASDYTAYASAYTNPKIHFSEISTCGSYTWFGSTYTQSGTYYHSESIPSGCTPITDTLSLTLSYENHWQGSVSEAWENPLNWSCGSIPDSNSMVYIDSSALFYPVINSVAWCKKIFLNNGSSLHVNPGFVLNVAGAD